MRKLIAILATGCLFLSDLKSQPAFGTDSFISFEKGLMTLSSAGKSIPLVISSDEWPGVIRAFKDLRSDIGNVTSALPDLYTDRPRFAREIILAGTIGKSALVEKLIRRKKIDVTAISGKWESFNIQIVEKPLPGVKRALVITGSDKRGTIYGIYEVSRQIGVSPWYWWADVTPDRHTSVYALPVKYTQGPPSVKYRGIFLNDEAPDLTNWIRDKYGLAPKRDNPPVPDGVANYGHEFYSRIFELLLRLKGNYLWPAMWNNAFNEDDSLNPLLADEYGIVMGNSHQEPMLRAQKEWDRRYQKTLGSWNYSKNPDILEAFWREGIRRNKDFESIVTIGLRGANDTPMAPGGPEANRSLLEKIVGVQRNILAEEINPDVTKIPQLWCLYKEVQDFYNAGMRVPDDVTLLWADDNWGNVRRLPTAEERKRSGGAGIYYHFDYHGGPRSYQWINTNPISRIWDQMSLAKQYGADRIWIVNAGHFRGYELPVEFFLDLGWNTASFTGENLSEYTGYWAGREFGPEYAAEIARIVTLYTKYNGRRKPELLSPSTYSLLNYNEAATVVSDFRDISVKAEEIGKKLPPCKHDAFYQLVFFPVRASYIVNELYYYAAQNNLFANQGRSSANIMARQVRSLFETDTSLMGYYNREFAGGRWNHFMDQAHLGYTSWADPPFNSLRAIQLKEVNVPVSSLPGISVEGSADSWPESEGSPELPCFDNLSDKSHYFDIYNKGSLPFEFSVKTSAPWINVSRMSGTIGRDTRITVKADWSKIDLERTEGLITVTGAGSTVNIKVSAFKPSDVTAENLEGFAEGEGYVSMEAEHFTGNKAEGSRQWVRIENYGNTLSAMKAEAPADSPPAAPGLDSPCLEYRMYLFTEGEHEVISVFSPSLNFIPGRGLAYGISFDDQPVQIVNLVPKDYNAQNRNTDWEKSVSDNARFSKTKHLISSRGYHTLRIWMIDPGAVLQKIIVDTGGLKPSYLGPPESFHRM